MHVEKDRRQWIREELEPPQIGILVTEDQGYQAGTNLVNPPQRQYVDLLNKSPGGAVLRLEKGLEQGATFNLQTYNDRRNVWESFRGETRWTSEILDSPNNFLLGAEYLELESNDLQPQPDLESSMTPCPDDYESLMRTRFFQSIPRSAICSILAGSF